MPHLRNARRRGRFQRASFRCCTVQWTPFRDSRMDGTPWQRRLYRTRIGTASRTLAVCVRTTAPVRGSAFTWLYASIVGFYTCTGCTSAARGSPPPPHPPPPPPTTAGLARQKHRGSAFFHHHVPLHASGRDHALSGMLPNIHYGPAGVTFTTWVWTTRTVLQQPQSRHSVTPFLTDHRCPLCRCHSNCYGARPLDVRAVP